MLFRRSRKLYIKIMRKTKKRVVVGMSGGVDSTVSAILLKQQGFDVSGVFMKIWDEKNTDTCINKSSCYGPKEKDIEDLKSICSDIGIQIYFIDSKKQFSRCVLDYFRKEYISGRTPNPCVICNRFIKFQFIPQELEKKGVRFDFFATGHYARVEYSQERKRYILKKGIDRDKDQSYFLFLLTQKQLSKIIFPLGNYTKQNVRDIAKQYRLDVYQKPESQDFIRGDRFFLFDKGTEPGEIIDSKGSVVGKHKGIIHYTIGQRRGTGIAKGKPLYVIKIDSEKNRIIVGDEKDLYRDKLIALDVNFIGIEKPTRPVDIIAKIRYKHPGAKARMYPLKNNEIEVVFNEPQRAITPGQAVVFYKGDEAIGGGFIK